MSARSPNELPARQFLVYCDESRYDPHKINTYLGIGGLWVPRPERDRLRRRLEDVAAAHGLNAELKWSKVSACTLEGYRAIIDAFAAEPALRFRVILVDQRRLDFRRFHDGDRELGFYKFYYEMLVKWLEWQQEYFILLDHKVNAGPSRYTDLRNVLQTALPFTTIARVEGSDSRASRLAQLADVLTGAVTAAWCDTRRGTPKAELQAHLACRVGLRSLRQKSASPAPGKFNIFEIQLARPNEGAGGR